MFRSKLIIAIIAFISLSGMRIVQDGYCSKVSIRKLSNLRVYDSFSSFSEVFDMKENCWSSEEAYDENYFDMTIPVLEDDKVQIKLVFRNEQINEISCIYSNINIDCKDLINFNKRKLDNMIILRDRMMLVR